MAYAKKKPAKKVAPKKGGKKPAKALPPFMKKGAKTDNEKAGQ